MKNVISHSPFFFFFFLPQSKNQHGGVKQLQREQVRKTLQRGDSPTGIKILQPVIFHLSYSSGIILWSPLRGIKSGLINIIETLMAAEQITTLSTISRQTHKQGQALIEMKGCWAAAWKSRKVALGLWTFIKEYLLHIHLHLNWAKDCWKMHNS